MDAWRFHVAVEKIETTLGLGYPSQFTAPPPPTIKG
jgi:hypothetical protein